jgi:hypothetical protein
MRDRCIRDTDLKESLPVRLARNDRIRIARNTHSTRSRALIGLSSWIESDFAAGVLRRLLQSRDLVVGGEYYFSAAKGGQERVSIKKQNTLRVRATTRCN